MIEIYKEFIKVDPLSIGSKTPKAKDAKIVPSILKMAIQNDWPLRSPRLSSIKTKRIDINRFCPNAIKKPISSLNKYDVKNTIKKLVTRSALNIK